MADEVRHSWIESRAKSYFILRFPPDHRLDELEAAFAEVERLSAAASRDFGFIIDFARMTHSSPKGRAVVIGAEKRINELDSVKRHCGGLALVVRNPFQQGVLTAVTWFARRPYASSVFTSLQEAEQWVEQRIALRRTTG